MDTNFGFSSFMDLDSYCKLQTKFLLNDYSQWHDNVKEPFKDKVIIYKSFEIEDGKEDYIKKEFIKDFIKPGINNLSNRHYRNFINRIISKNLLTKELQEGLAKLYLDNINKANETFKKSKFLSPGIIVLLLKQLRLLQDQIEGFLDNPYPNIKTKIEFNWSRTDLIYFFHLLRVNKQIEFISDGDLGRIIDSIAQCKNKEGDSIDISNSRKHLNAFKNVEGRPENLANGRLKNIFLNDDFYNV
ncbi:hypothetical protein [Winogradskyella poriferorum]|uniref:DUF262 domain-containing protein n=1 Tax=Winogradskyella poriferorum TaxID=307627 RepID=A0ABU7W1J5_9FLAO